MTPRVVYVLPATSLHGGNRVVFEHAEGLQARGYDVTVVSPEPAPDWHETTVPYRQIPLWEPGSIPEAEICIGTFWSTLEYVERSGAPHLFHLCQGYEGVHREYGPILPKIEAVYRLPIPKLLISKHLEPVLHGTYPGIRTYLLGQAIDTSFFVPGSFRETSKPLRFGVVGPFDQRPKGIGEALEGLRRARERGTEVEVFRASADPMLDAERDLGVTDRFFHRLSTAEMVGFYQGLDALIHPSHDEEGFPLPPLEAMACGVPVALTEIRSFAVLPKDAILKFLPAQPQTLVPLIESLKDVHLRRRLRSAGRVCAESYQMDLVLDRMERAFAFEGAPVVRPKGAIAVPGVERGSGVEPVSSPGPESGSETLSCEQPDPTGFRADPSALQAQYVQATPFPHLAIDDLFDPEWLERVILDFPEEGEEAWRFFDNTKEKKAGFDYRAAIGDDLRQFLTFLNSPPTLEFLEKLTGIDGLVPDPYFGGAGPHQSFRGGFLKVHADFNWHPKMKLDRRVNMLIYLNKDWRDEYGGHLELWDREVSRCEQKILPIFNRTAIFNTTDFSFHGHPTPMQCPETMSRKSISMYYYTNGRPDEERSAPHDTVFKKTHDNDW